MLYVFHGTDVFVSLEKARKLGDSLRAKRPDASFVEMDADNWIPSAIEEHASGQGLFSSKYIIFLNRVTENIEAKESLAGLVKHMNDSANIFILLEGRLNAELKRAVEKDAEKMVASDLKEIKPKSEFNIFALTGALAKRDAFTAWKTYREAIDSGIEPENIAGVLFWTAKSMTSKELARDLVVLYHDGHRGILDLELGIEKLLLSC